MSMFLPFLLALPLLFLVFLSLKNIKKGYEKPRNNKNLPPGPPKLPFIGNLHQFSTTSSLNHRRLHQLSMRYGPLMSLQLGSKPTVVISSARIAREVLKTHDLEFASRPSFVCQQKLSYGGHDIAFAPYGECWRELRKICITELFNTKRVQSFRCIREDEIFQLIKSISGQLAASSSTPVNLTDVALALSNNIICRIAFGKTFQHESCYKCSFSQLLKEAQALFVSFAFADYFPSLGWVFDILSGLPRRLERNFQGLDLFYSQVIEEHLDPKRPKPQEEDIADVLLRMHKDHSSSLHLKMEHIKALFMNIFIAGTDTTAATVVWAMSELAKKPIAMKKVQDELRSLVGNKGHIDEDDVNQLHYLKYVVKETLRLHPPTPLLLPRETINHCKIDGYDIYPKTQVFVNGWAIGMEPEIWKNPEEFIPERFIDGSVDFKGQHFEFIPFGSGRRICPGMHVGVATVELILANLLYSFNWELPDGMKNEDIHMDELPGITVKKKTPLLLLAINTYNEF
ncbi:PREDICTED: cytochrome P450 71A1-like [Nelumbo nucifera]|uniref:Cytochrome P450 71A1-like n=1 Tax=Nelumbo nucifera TaxID=4432 RepID=A0A1U8B6B1_NELNU|nr:PREDICTED: cytochrome P450 71A1-like [Nelumbo nucifera]